MQSFVFRETFPYRKTKPDIPTSKISCETDNSLFKQRDLFSSFSMSLLWMMDICVNRGRPPPHDLDITINPKNLKSYSLAGVIQFLCTKKSWLFQLLQNQMWFFLLSNEKSPLNCITRHEKRLKMKPKWNLKWRRRSTLLCAKKKHQHCLESKPWKQWLIFDASNLTLQIIISRKLIVVFFPF